MDLTLYKMAPTGRINLTGLVSNREAFYTGERDPETGVVTLTPVTIVSAGSAKHIEPVDDDPLGGDVNP